MRQQITVLSPCKINLSLQVVGLRPDGYHELRSVMQAVDVYNRLDIRLDQQPGIRLVCDDPAVPNGPSNTAWRAAAAFFEALARAPAVCLSVKKSAPAQAGMGSASADAAGALYGLNRLYGDPLDADALAALALSVGADVPFASQAAPPRAGIGGAPQRLAADAGLRYPAGPADGGLRHGRDVCPLRPPVAGRAKDAADL